MTLSGFEAILQDVARTKVAGQSDSKALLNWFLFNVFRLDDIDARDSICDKENDKGIDGVWADEDSEEIYLFQAKYTKLANKTLGDTDLKDFVGSASWFAKAESVEKLLKSTANSELKSLATRHMLVERIQKKWPLRLVFVTTRRCDTNAKEYIATHEENTEFGLEVWDQDRLLGYQSLLNRTTRVAGSHTFHIGKQYFDHQQINGGIDSIVAAVGANDIAAMKGIADRTLFALNVRLPLGRTRVNKDLETAIRQTKRHPQFILFHNGVTVICRTMKIEGEMLTITDYSIVNGCQSAIAFYNNRKKVTDGLRVLAKFVEVGDDDALAKEITYSTNNQNGINLRDLRSNDRIQTALKSEFERLFGNEIKFLIKAGDEASGAAISNDRAGQIVMSLYLDEPYNAHQKYRLFGPDYERVFGRKTTAAKIYLGYAIYKAIEDAASGIKDSFIRDYQLTRFILLGLLGGILRQEKVGAALLETPLTFLPKDKQAVTHSIVAVVKLMIADFDFFVKEKQQNVDYYDYKSEFKSPSAYKAMALEIQKSYARAVARYPKDAFDMILNEKLGKTASE